MRRVTLMLSVLWVVLLVGGCSSESLTDSAGMEPSSDFARSEMGQDVTASDDEVGQADNSDSDVPSEGDAALETTRQLIYVADIRLVVEDFSTVEGKSGISQLIEQYGGHAADVSIERDQGRARSGHWQARIPIKNYRTFLDKLQDLGYPEHLRETTEDVTAQYVDLDARIRNKQRLEERFLQLLDRSAGKINELIEVERELGRVRGEIERMQSMFRSLESRIKMTTVTINVREERNYEPPQAPSFSRRIGKAWETSISMIDETSKTLLVVLVGLIPWLLVLAAFLLFLVLLIWAGIRFGRQIWRWRRK